MLSFTGSFSPFTFWIYFYCITLCYLLDLPFSKRYLLLSFLVGVVSWLNNFSYSTFPLVQFLRLNYIDLLGQIICCVGAVLCIVGYFCSIAGFYSLDVRNTPPAGTIKNVSRHCQMSPGPQNCPSPQVRTTSVTMRLL